MRDGLGLLVGDRRAGITGRDLTLTKLLVLVVAAIAANRAAELADPTPQGATELWQAFRPEDDQGNDQDYCELEGSNVWHQLMVTGDTPDRDHFELMVPPTRFWGFLRLLRKTAD
jgi:hypothetical protein